MAYDQATAARVRKILSPRRDVVEKALMGGLSFMIAGNMACSVSGRGGLLVRVSPEGMNAALREPHAEPAAMGGKTMTGFVRVTPEGYRGDAALTKWIQRGLNVALTLPKKM